MDHLAYGTTTIILALKKRQKFGFEINIVLTELLVQ